MELLMRFLLDGEDLWEPVQPIPDAIVIDIGTDEICSGEKGPVKVLVT